MKFRKTQIFFLLISLFMISCDGVKNNKDGKAGFEKSLIEGVDINAKLAARSNLLEDMSQLVPLQNIADALGLEVSQLKKVPSRAANSNTCFFKWEDPNFPNTGIMMQVKTNPYPSDLPNWAMVTMNRLRANGENGLVEDNYRYKELPGMATEGLYNADIGKYYWRFSDEVILFLAFNTMHEQDEQIKIANNLGAQMIKNYLDI
ncbi:MAG: hypothetical protein P8M34_14155 [Saprospiraceae bacterium]|nr:hypothetical protein [Saprospiraceae bacterium]